MPTRSTYALVLLLPVLGACEPGASGRTREPLEMPVERERVYLRRAHHQGTPREAALSIVKQHRMEEGGRTVEEWLDDRMGDQAGNVLFPEWEVMRIAPHRFDVRFSFTQITLDSRIRRRGYSWEADTALGTVVAHRELEADELSAHPSAPRIERPRSGPRILP